MSLHLSRMSIPYEVAARWNKGRGFADAYGWHQRLWEAFPDRDGQARDYLFRVDPMDDFLRVLVLSTAVPSRPAWCPEDGWKTKVVEESFLSHTQYRFSLLANPTRKVREDSEGNKLKNGRRVPLRHRDDREVQGKTEPGYLTWLRRKGEQHGFAFEDAAIKTLSRPRQHFVKDGAGVVHSTVEFQGTLIVTDREKFRQAFIKGIGSAKAFGFGMFCLVPVISNPNPQ